MTKEPMSDERKSYLRAVCGVPGVVHNQETWTFFLQECLDEIERLKSKAVENEQVFNNVSMKYADLFMKEEHAQQRIAELEGQLADQVAFRATERFRVERLVAIAQTRIDQLENENAAKEQQLAAASRDAEQGRLIAEYANSNIDWDGVSNSKILSVFIQEYIEELVAKSAAKGRTVLEDAIRLVCFYCKQGVKFESGDFHYPGDYFCPATPLRRKLEGLK